MTPEDFTQKHQDQSSYFRKSSNEIKKLLKKFKRKINIDIAVDTEFKDAKYISFQCTTRLCLEQFYPDRVGKTFEFSFIVIDILFRD